MLSQKDSRKIKKLKKEGDYYEKNVYNSLSYGVVGNTVCRMWESCPCFLAVSQLNLLINRHSLSRNKSCKIRASMIFPDLSWLAEPLPKIVTDMDFFVILY